MEISPRKTKADPDYDEKPNVSHKEFKALKINFFNSSPSTEQGRRSIEKQIC